MGREYYRIHIETRMHERNARLNFRPPANSIAWISPVRRDATKSIQRDPFGHVEREAKTIVESTAQVL